MTSRHTSAPSPEADAKRAIILADPEHPTPSPQEMFLRDFQVLSMVTGVAAIIAGVLQIGLPGQLIRLLQLDGASSAWLRVLGIVGLLIGIGILVNSRFPPRRDTIGAASAVFLGSAVFFIGAPFAFGINVGWFGWIVLFGAFLFTFGAAIAWFFLHDWLTPVPDYSAPTAGSESGTGGASSAAAAFPAASGPAAQVSKEVSAASNE